VRFCITIFADPGSDDLYLLSGFPKGVVRWKM